MRQTRNQRGWIFIVLLVGLAWLLPASVNAAEVSTSGLDQQIAVEVTAYNEDLGLIKDQRRIQLPKGVTVLRFMDVAGKINPTTVHMQSLTEPKSLSVLEQNYEYDLLSPARLLDKYVGKDVKLYSKNPYTEREEIVTARVLSNNDNNPVFQIGNEVTFGYPGRIIFPQVPENLIAQPTLVWLLKNETVKAQDVEVAYLTGGIGWRADYVLVLDAQDQAGGLSGWVTLNNQSGATYPNAKLKLVAGDVNRVREELAGRRDVVYKAQMMEAAAPQFREQSFFEYHIYTLERPTTLKDNSTKQISLLNAPEVKVKKEYRLYGEDGYYRGRYGDPEQKKKVSVFIGFENTKQNGMGMPLPKGIVRVYKHDADKSLQFTGEDTIDHTPKDEKVKIKLGEAFDVVATRKQMDWKKIASDTYEAAFEIALRNHKEENVTVRVIEPVPGDWQVISSSHKAAKTSSSQLEMQVPVLKNGETVVTYRVRMRF
jgi:hypothetical protein